jgi:hypothetical protein
MEIMSVMKLISVKRKTVVEDRYTPKMGKLQTRVTYIKRKVLNIPVQTIHKYRETYYGEVKDCADCNLQH